MSLNRKKQRRFHRSQHGQVLIFALIALVALVIAGLFLFDVHTVIRGKVKGQSAVDAAALTGAMWQMNALNIIGELNIIKATTILTEDFIVGKDKSKKEENVYWVITQMKPLSSYYGVDENGKRYFDEDAFRKDLLVVIDAFNRLDDAVQMLTQMQVRVGFVLPLIGYGAAQQAAKNNGVTVNEDVQAMLEDMYSDINDPSLYGDPNLAPQNLYGYMWRQSYADMVQALYQSGVAVGTSVERLGSPFVDGMLYYLCVKEFYAAVLARNWCHLQGALKESYNGAWWGKFEAFANSSFSGQSELLPLHIEYVENAEGTARAVPFSEIFPKRFTDEPGSPVPLSEFYDSANPYFDVLQKNASTGAWEIDESKLQSIVHSSKDTDYRFNILPEITWATYGSEWNVYSDDFKREWGEYLRTDFKDGYDYESGAVSYFTMRQPTKTLTSNFSDSESGRSGDLGKPFDYNSEASSDISTAQRNLRNGVQAIETDALGKPFGRIKLENGSYKSPMYPARMVLPVFTETGLVPVAMETVYGDSQTDRNWIRFLVEYLPILGESNSLADAWTKVLEKYPNHAHLFSGYHYALTLMDDPEFRQQGIDWLNKYSGRCDNWPSGGTGSRRGPGKIH